jgi:hypothetical protein
MKMRLASIAVVLAASLAAGTASAQERAKPQPKPEDLKPGLAVGYSYGYVQSLREIRTPGSRDGEPLKQLNHAGDGNVLTTTHVEGVQADIEGFIKLDASGTYVFTVMSNDGVRVTLGGKKILEDDFIHSDRMSKPAEVKVTEPGWYKLNVLYFQRKGTYALELHWTKPDGTKGIVPPEAYAYVKQ